MKLNSIMIKIANLAISRIAIVGLFVTGFYYISFYDTGETIINEINALKTQVNDENSKKAETERLLKKEEQMRADVALLAKTYEDVRSKIPLTFDPPELRAIVDQVGSANGLDVVRFDNNVSGVMNQSLVGSEDANLIDQVAVKYELQGNYVQLARFATQLANVQKIIKLEDVIITNAQTNSQAGPQRKLKFDATIIGYKQAALMSKESDKDKAVSK
ncbi:MAG: type 4a pilus biogenesis protein PilO [Pseudobdellovibrio sp.]